MDFINFDRLEKFLVEACEYYEKSAPTVEKYLDNLYQRINDGGDVLLREITQVSRLRENGIWQQPNYAANQIYKLQKDLGQDTTGHAGF